MALKKKTYINGQTVIDAENLNDIQDEIIGTKTSNGTVVSQNADFAEVAEWDDGNPNNEDRTGYFVCANVPLNGIVMKKATSLDDVKGVSILAPAFAGNYTADKLDSEGNLLPKYSFVAVLGFVPVIDNGTCTVGGRCMPDDNGCAIPSSNSMGYQVVNRIDENRVLIIIEPNGDMVQRIKTRVNELQEDIDNLAEKWEKIVDTTLTDGDAVLNVTTDMNGGTFALKRFFVVLKKAAKDGDTTKSVVWVKGLTAEIQTFRPFIATEGMTALANNTLQTWRFEGEIQHLWNTKAYATTGHVTNSVFSIDYYGIYGARDYFLNRNPVTAFQFTWGYSGALPNGSRVEIWGVRA